MSNAIKYTEELSAAQSFQAKFNVRELREAILSAGYSPASVLAADCVRFDLLGVDGNIHITVDTAKRRVTSNFCNGSMSY